MKICAFALRLDGGEREKLLDGISALDADFKAACQEFDVQNFSLWQMENYVFGYGECLSGDMCCFDGVLDKLPEGVCTVCRPGSMRLMYHDTGIVREDKGLIRHRVFGARLKPDCEEEYKRRHDGLIAARGSEAVDHHESNFTIWCGDGHIFGYCEFVKAFDREPTPQERESTIAWEKKQLEIMDWLTDDVDWISGEKHDPVRRIL